MEHPAKTAKERECLTLYVKINRHKAYTLFDSGSTADTISPDFSRVVKVPCKTLDPVAPYNWGAQEARGP